MPNISGKPSSHFRISNRHTTNQWGILQGIYRVGPLARLNLVAACGTPQADAELEYFRELDFQSSFHYHYARLIEILYGFEKIDELLHTEDILSDRVRPCPTQ